jgi:2'-5' RNA ligase
MSHPLLSNTYNTQPLFSSKQLAVSEYLLILQPHEDLYNKILDIKRSFADTYDCPMAAFLKPHLTLIKFMQFEMQQARIVQKLEHFMATTTPFKVDLDGFGGFPSHTIYLNVKTKNPIVRLVKSLRPVQPLLKFDAEHTPHFITEPHITIARRLLPWQYEKSWLEFSNTPFSASFMATNAILLKRKVGNKSYAVAASFPLLGKEKEKVMQASLFV